MKMFGQLTRTKHIWIPDPLLCKRFNVMNPFPGQKAIDTAKELVERENQLEQELKGLGDKKYVEQQPPHQIPGKLAFEREQEATVSADNPSMASLSYDNKDEGPAMNYERASMDLFKAIFEEDDDFPQDPKLQVDTENGVSLANQLPEAMADDSESNLIAPSEAQNSRKTKGPTFPQLSDVRMPGHSIDSPAVDQTTDISTLENQKIQTKDFEGKVLTGISEQRTKRHERRHRESRHGRRERSKTHRSRKEGSSQNSTDSEDVVIWTEKTAV